MLFDGCSIFLNHALFFNALYDNTLTLLNCWPTQFVSHSFAYLQSIQSVVYLACSMLLYLYSRTFSLVLVWPEIYELVHLFAEFHSSFSCQSVTWRKYSVVCVLTVSLDHILARFIGSFTDKLKKNAECPPLECWECDSWIPTCFPQHHCLKKKQKSKNAGLENRMDACSYSMGIVD